MGTKPTPTEPDRIVTNECFTDIFASKELSTFVKSKFRVNWRPHKLVGTFRSGLK